MSSAQGENFAHKDVVFEVFHNFVALSQWGNTMYNIMLKLAKDTGDPEARAWFKRTMEGSPDDAGGKPFTPLERFVMELFRTITPNGGSISALTEVRTPPYERHGYVVTPHKTTSFDPLHWKDPDRFNPDRYNGAPTSHEIDEAKCEQIVSLNVRLTEQLSTLKTVEPLQFTIAASAPLTASSTASRFLYATMRASRHSALAIAAVPASN